MTMKKTLALMAGCALCVSAAMAAVQGNNTAVIVQKTPAVTTANYQFLCVPVRGFDITGQGTNDAVALSAFLPASTLADGTTVTLPGPDGVSQTIYKVQSGAWGKASGVSTVALTAEEDPMVETGTTLWLLIPATENGTPSNICFVGEKTKSLGTDEKLITPTAGMVAYGNNTAEPIKVSQIAEPQDGDQIQRITDGGATYQVYHYVADATTGEGAWLNWNNAAQTVDDETIAPGEAFYYYRAAGVN